MWRYRLKCPRCGKTTRLTGETSPTVKCGDCLMERIEVVDMQVIDKVKTKQAGRNGSAP
jgi:hypothetical protein